MEFTHDIFLSYNRDDPKRHLVSDLNGLFKGRNFQTYFDEKNLTEAPSGPITALLEAGLATSRIILILVGTRGLGPHQKLEAEEAYRLQAEARAKGDRWPEVIVMRLGQLTHDELKEIVPPQLTEGLSFAHPPNLQDAGFTKVVTKLADAEQEKPVVTPTPDIEEAPSLKPNFEVKSELASQIVDHGLVAFLGNSWPDRHLTGVFDPDEFGNALRQQFNIPPDVALGAPLEMLTGYAQLTLKNQRDEVSRLRTSMAVRPPKSYSELASLIASARDQQSTVDNERRPFIAISTAQDALLEKEFLSKALSFLLIRVNRSECDQVLFHVSDLNPLTLQNGMKISGLPADARSFMEAATQDDIFATDWSEAEDLKMVLEPPDDASSELFNHYRSEVFTGEGERDLAWRNAELDRLIREHGRKYAIKAPWIKENGPPVSLIVWAISQQLPVIIKLCGCVHQDEDIKMRMSRFSTIGEPAEMLPRWLRSLIIGAPSVFAGFSPVGYAFQTMYWRELHRTFDDSNARRQRRVFFSPEVLESNDIPASALIDRIMAQRLGERDLPMNEITFVSGLRASEAFKQLRFEIG